MNDDPKTSTDDPWKEAAPPRSIALLSVKLDRSIIILLKPDAWMPPPSSKALQLTKAHLVRAMSQDDQSKPVRDVAKIAPPWRYAVHSENLVAEKSTAEVNR
jgi:hypothetical protein